MGLAPLGSFAVGSVVVMVLTGLVSGALAVAVAVASGLPLADAARDPTALLTAGVLGVSATIQMGLLLAMAALLARQFDDDQLGTARILGLSPAPWSFWAAGGVGALTVGLLPGWGASRVLETFPELGGSLGALGEAIANSSPLGSAVLAVAVCLGAPIAEELAFRGYLWHHLARLVPGWAAWIGSSVVFSLYHMDPIQSVSLLPTALFLGWLRWASGSVGPAVLGHFVNNALALGVMVAWPGSDAISFAAALAGASFTLACCVGAAFAHRRLERR